MESNEILQAIITAFNEDVGTMDEWIEISAIQLEIRKRKIHYRFDLFTELRCNQEY